MPIQLRGRHLLTLKDFSPEEIRFLLDLSIDLKRKKRSGIPGDLLKEKNIVLLFEKASTRTRCAFETAAFDEGARVTYLTNSQMGKKESIEDTAKVLGRYYDGIEFRGFSQDTVEEIARYAGVPVWNGLTDFDHPTQVLADLMTIMEHADVPLHEVKMAFVGDIRNNMARALMIGAAKTGMDLSLVGPKELAPDAELVKEMQELGCLTGSEISVTDSIAQGTAGADIIYTDVWVSMGEEDLFEKRIKLLKPYQVNTQMLRMAKNQSVKFMHCLPAFHDLETETAREVHRLFGLEEMEVTDEVFRSPCSIVFDQAENRLHTIKAVMAASIGNL